MSISNLPFFSIITPSLNQGEFIERAIKSVINQKYPNFEHIIIDGGSTDKTLAIIKRYKHLKWISQPDNGHIEAVNKGLGMARGKVIGLLNTDDYYQPDAFFSVARAFSQSDKIEAVVGNCNVVDEKGRFIEFNKPSVKFEELLQVWRYQHPYNPSAYFYYKDIHKIIGSYQVKYGAPYDYKFLLELSHKFNVYYIDQTLGNFRYYPGTITYKSRNNDLRNKIKISREYWGGAFSFNFYKYYFSLLFFLYIFPVPPKIISWLRKKVALRTRVKKYIDQAARKIS